MKGFAKGPCRSSGGSSRQTPTAKPAFRHEKLHFRSNPGKEERMHSQQISLAQYDECRSVTVADVVTCVETPLGSVVGARTFHTDLKTHLTSLIEL